MDSWVSSYQPANLYDVRPLVHPHLYHVRSRARLSSDMDRAGEEVEEMELPIPLSEGEQLIIQDTWAKVYLNSEEVGVAILLR